ncbi:MAG: hypothetical protein MSA01_06280 [Anaeromassilibacillus sp.]|nr:hypothetical protein [Anaeromassilibacillus sp.]
MQLAIDHYGEENQLDMAIEEMSELTKAICKYKRLKKAIASNSGSVNKRIKEWDRYYVTIDDIKEEIADVYVMLEQLTVIFNCKERVSAIASEKIDRLKWRMNNGE